MDVERKLELITQNLQEIIGVEELKFILQSRDVRIYWGTATTGRPHIAYFLPILKIRDFLEAGCEVKILMADIHAFLDNLKAPIELVNLRVRYYEKLIKAMLTSLGVDMAKITFVQGSTYQKGENYVMDLYKLSTLITDRDARKAGSQVVKQIENPKLSALIYPCMQALDEEYLDVDAQLGGVDQRKIFTFAMKYLPMIGYRKRTHLMNTMIDGLNASKMSSSDVFSKIDLIEDAETIKSKIKKCYCAEKDVSSGIFQLLQHVIFPVFHTRKMNVEIKNQQGVCTTYELFDNLKRDFESGAVHPGDLKASVAEMLETIVRPIREEMLGDRDLINKAYP